MESSCSSINRIVIPPESNKDPSKSALDGASKTIVASIIAANLDYNMVA